jgi:hypothetical protein
MIEVIFQVRKDKFKDHPAVIEELDLIEEDDQFVHLVTLEDALESQDMLSEFLNDVVRFSGVATKKSCNVILTTFRRIQARSGLPRNGEEVQDAV